MYIAVSFSDWMLEQANCIKNCPVVDNLHIMRYDISDHKLNVRHMHGGRCIIVYDLSLLIQV